MPRSAKTFAFGRKKRSYKNPRGIHAAKKPKLMCDEPVAGPSQPSTSSTSPPTRSSDPDPPTVATTIDDQLDAGSATHHDREPDVEPEEDMPLDTSRSEQKLTSFRDSSTTQLDQERYYLIHSSFLMSLLEVIVCPTCFGSDVNLSTSKDLGLACSFLLECKTCKKVVWKHSSSPKPTHRHDINVRAVVASKECGVPFTAMKSMFNIMNIPNLMHHKTFNEIGREVRMAAVDAGEEVMQESADMVREANLYATEQTSPSGVQVVSVSYDGTWHKRGHSSHYGVGVAIDIDSGLVLDTHTVSNYCLGCNSAPPLDSPNYAKWKQQHDAVCNKNFEGTSNAMESKAAEIIFSRSVEKRNLINGTMLCDGDSKALNRVNEIGIYDIDVKKEDCVNHIAKRIYNQLEQVKKDNKDKLNKKLTAAKIKKINTYATNLRENAPDVEKMKLGVMGGLFHMMSTDDAPNHRLCPGGETSWCKYKRALAKGEDPPPHNPTITTDVGRFVFPIIKRLTEPALLARCAKMTTQNPNESFNSTIWRRCPKVLFAHLPMVQTAVALSVITFNVGPAGLRRVFHRLGLSWSEGNNSHATAVAATRIRQSRNKTKHVSKWRRKHLHHQKLVQKDKREETEGITYSSGAFNN